MAKIVTANTRQRTVIRDLKTEKVYAYDYDNSYPQRIYDLINSSGTAKASYKLYSKYVMGSGISDPDLYKKVVNRMGMTFDKLLRACVDDYCMFGGFAVHVAYNALGEVTGYNHVPFEWTRLSYDPDNMIAVYDNWDKRKIKDNGKYDVNKIVRFNRYNRATVLKEIESCQGYTIQEKMQHYNGQVYWFSIDNPETYPLSPFDAIIEDIQTDSEIKVGKLKNVKTNFLASQMVKYKGRFESDQERNAFMTSLEDFQGNDNLGNIMLVEVTDTEGDFSVVPFTLQDFDKKWEYTERSVQENIIRTLNQPQVLLSMTVAGKLGTANEIADAEEFYNKITEYDRLIIEEEFTRLIGSIVNIIPVGQEAETAENVEQVNVAATALNGAQISSLNEIIANVTTNIYPVETARGIIAASFPFLLDSQIDSILNPLSNTNATNPAI
jgi:hypothetical protein